MGLPAGAPWRRLGGFWSRVPGTLFLTLPSTGLSRRLLGKPEGPLGGLWGLWGCLWGSLGISGNSWAACPSVLAASGQSLEPCSGHALFNPARNKPERRRREGGWWSRGGLGPPQCGGEVVARKGSGPLGRRLYL